SPNATRRNAIAESVDDRVEVPNRRHAPAPLRRRGVRRRPLQRRTPRHQEARRPESSNRRGRSRAASWWPLADRRPTRHEAVLRTTQLVRPAQRHPPPARLANVVSGPWLRTALVAATKLAGGAPA